MTRRQAAWVTTAMVLIAAALAVAVLAAAPQQTASAERQLEAAIHREQVLGDVKGAIELYQQLAAGGDRPVAAQALVRMGQCYEKLGEAQVTQARAAYERVVREFGDQSAMAGEARARLAALRQASPAPTEPTIRARRLLAGHYNNEVDFSGGPTPDGRGLVYVDATGKNLAIRDLQTGASRLITNRASEDGYMGFVAVVSPDGRFVAYSWSRSSVERPFAGMELRVVGVDGSRDRMLREESSIYPASWSSDGRHIVAQIAQGEGSQTEIAWIAFEDGSKRSLGTFPAADGGVLSPDDRFVAVQVPAKDDSGRHDIVLLPTKGGSVLPLVDHPADDRLMGWIPGTNDLLFTSDRSGNQDLWAIRIGDDGRAGSPRPVRRGTGEMSPMGFTRDGSLFYSVYTLQYNIFTAPVDEKSGRITLDEAKPLGGRGSNMKPSWSPNGAYLAFARRTAPRNGKEIVYVLNTKTGEERALVEDIAPATVPASTWFPDGRSLLTLGMSQTDAATSPGKVPSVAYRVNLATGAPTRLFEFPPNPYWWSMNNMVASPDGEGVIYAHDGRLVLRHLESGVEDELYRHAGLATGILELSPDGTELVFAIANSASVRARVWPDQGGRLMVMPSRGGEVRELLELEEPGTVRNVAWTADGRYVLFLQYGAKRMSVMRVPRQGGKAEQLWETQDTMLRDLSISPDGRRVAYFTQENEAEIWVLENIKQALVRVK
jgi:Tol biopolymer transport system component